MSVLIKGIDMPINCADCFLEDAYDGYNCRIAQKSANWGLGERPSWCPLAEAPRWIPVTEKLPERNGFYLCLYESKAKGGVAMDEGLSILQFINKKWCLFDSYVVTHWLPIPEPPKEE